MIPQRPCAILVADSQQAATFRGLFGAENWHLKLGCGFFEFDPEQDILVSPRRDPGVYNEAHELLRCYQNSHQHAIVVLDCSWSHPGGKPLGQTQIVADITSLMEKSGWPAGSIKVIAIDPMLENWFWQDNPKIADILGYRSTPSLRNILMQEGLWPDGASKPPEPKQALDWLLKKYKLRPRSGAIFEELARQVSFKGCTDSAFLELRNILKYWFPPSFSEQ